MRSMSAKQMVFDGYAHMCTGMSVFGRQRVQEYLDVRNIHYKTSDLDINMIDETTTQRLPRPTVQRNDCTRIWE